jgi:enoyl-CoA hydratase/carnithine racemase
MPSEMLTERRGKTLVLTLSEPATRNAVSPQACAAGIEALNVADADAAVRAVILRGDGEHFCGGGQLRRLAGVREGPQDEYARSMENMHGFVDAIRAFPKPVIAAVEGWAAGAGFSLALACDLLVAAENANFLMADGKVGLSPDAGGTWHLQRALPRALALQWMWLPEPVPAREMKSLGLVNWLADPGQALNQALRVAERLAEMAPNAIASVKDLVNRAATGGLRPHLDLERDAFVENLFDRNGGEGIQAFFEKRPPRFE